MTKKKIYIKTWGCQMNEYDSSMITNLLQNKYKFEKTYFPELADILILNTCSIREKAQEKVFHQLGRWRKLRKKTKCYYSSRWLCSNSRGRRNFQTCKIRRHHFRNANIT